MPNQTANPASNEEHRQRHVALDKSLNELFADYIDTTGKSAETTLLSDFLQWSHDQAQNPSGACELAAA